MTIPTTETEWCETLLSLRKEGLTCQGIADHLSTSVYYVKLHWHLLPPELRQVQSKIRSRLFAFLDSRDDTHDLTAWRIAELIGCSKGGVGLGLDKCGKACIIDLTVQIKFSPRERNNKRA